MAGKVVLIAGLPGSGKSTYGDRLRREIGAAEFVDDYHAFALNDSPDFDQGRRFQDLILGLRSGQTWIASDIQWCQKKQRRAVERKLRGMAPGCLIEWHFVVADPEICRQRVIARGNLRAEIELSYIDLLARRYSIPSGSIVVHSD